MKRNYWLHVLIGLNQFACTLLGGWPDETLSSYAYRLERQGKFAGRVFRPLIDWVFRKTLQHKTHCESAYKEEKNRQQVALELR